MRKVALALLAMSLAYVPMSALAHNAPAPKFKATTATAESTAYRAALAYQKTRCGAKGWVCEEKVYGPDPAIRGPYNTRRYQWAATGYVLEWAISNDVLLNRECQVTSTWTAYTKRWSGGKTCSAPHVVPTLE